jgi:ribosome-associated protein
VDDLTIDRRHVIPGVELEMRAARASGPGGQGVNTTDSAVELRWNVDDSVALTDTERRRVRSRLSNRITQDGTLIVRAADHRSQHRNREAARSRLRDLLRAALRPPKKRKPTRPTRASKERRLESKRRRGETKRLRRRPPEP